MMLNNLKIGLLGGGNMGYAIVAGLLRSGHPPQKITVAEPANAQQARLRALSPALHVTADNKTAASAADVLVVAVKPQVIRDAMQALAGASLRPQTLVMSVAAGVTLSSLADWLPGPQPIVRVMPNQPALIGEGISVLTSGVHATDTHRDQAEYIAGATGKTAWIQDEGLMDAVTAVSGSGPAYFYLLMELMEAAAVKLGLPADMARAVVRQTALGAARVAAEPGADVVALRASVTSPGGTTEAAIAVLEHEGLRETMTKAIEAGRDRGIELGRLSRK
jgi:pyrroline-5-carboxylate reductase